MAVLRMAHIGIVVDDLEGAVEFFTRIGLQVSGRTSVGGEAVDRIIAVTGARSDLVFLETPDGGGTIELTKFTSPAFDGEADAQPSNAPGIRHVLFEVDDIDGALAGVRELGYDLVGELVQYEDIYRLCYVRGPAGIIVELAEKVK